MQLINTVQSAINEYASFALFIAIVAFVVWADAKRRPQMMAKCASLDVERWIKRTEQDMRHCTSFESLDRLEEKGNKIIENAKALVSDTKPYADRLLKAYNSRHIDLTNIHCPGWPQSALRLINLR